MGKLVLVEGPQGVGKTTLTNILRDKITCSNMYRLSGHNDKTMSGLEKSTNMYESMVDHFKYIKDAEMNILLDRFYTTEEVYARLGFKDYSFTNSFYALNNRLARNFGKDDIVVINLTCRDEEVLRERLTRDKPQYEGVVFSVDNSLRQQDMYSEVLREFSTFFGCEYHEIETSYGYNIDDIVGLIW